MTIVAIIVATISLAVFWAYITTYVLIQNYEFRPKDMTIKAGTTITWVNTDLYVHTARSGTIENPTSEFDSGDLGIMGIYSHKFTKPGVYEYHCQPHPYMIGRIIVEP